MAQTHHRAAPPKEEESEAAREARAREEEAAVLAKAEEATAGLPTPGSPVRPEPPPGSAAAEALAEKTVKMYFPHGFSLTMPDYSAIHFREGIQDVPASLAGHEYLKAHGGRAV